jgi:hypothetical protein
MRVRIDARRWLLGLLGTPLAVGCASVLGPSPQAPDRPLPRLQAPPPGTAAVPPAPDLRIPGPPTAVPTAPKTDAPVLLPAQAVMPPQPPLPSRVDLSAAPGDIAPLARLRALHRQAAETYAGIDSYIVRLRRREVVGGRNKPEEVLLFKFRKQPWSVYFKWLGKEGAGREAIYVKGRYEDKLHTLLAAGDMPLAPAGKHIALPPDSFLVRSSSRHTIHEAGVGALIDAFGNCLASLDKGDGRHGSLKYLGPIQRPEFETPGEAVEQTIPPGDEPQLPKGGLRLWVFDPCHHLPVLVRTLDETGREVEYYCYERFQYPVKLDDDDFDPERMGGKP